MLLTMDGRQGVEAIRWIQPRQVIPIHYDDYPVFKSSLAEFKREVEAAGLGDRVIYLERGQRHTFAVGPNRWPALARKGSTRELPPPSRR